MDVRNGVGGVVRGDCPDTPCRHQSDIQELWDLPDSYRHCGVATPVSWATFYNIEVIIAFAFRLDTYEAEKIRRKVLECVCQQKERGVSLFFSLGGVERRYN